MLVGIFVEGNDWLIVHTLLAKLLAYDERSIKVDRIDLPGLGWTSILEGAEKTLRRFYNKCCNLAVIGVDNDGNRNGEEDPNHPRHWLHTSSPHERCRQCALETLTERIRPALDWIPNKPGSSWPILICVPVEAVESWLLVAQAIARPGHGSLHAENEVRSAQKQAFYGRPLATREDVEDTALPLLRSLSPEQILRLRTNSRSFDLFAEQVLAPAVRGGLAQACWT
jgi:hypothetical protein